MDHLERLRSWPIENPEQWWEQQQRFWELAKRRGYVDSQQRRALKHDAFIEHIDPKLVHKLCEGNCGICGEPVSLKELTMDHVVPLSRGGSHSYENIQCSHASCNRWKGDRLPSELDPAEVPPSPRRVKLPYRNSSTYRQAKTASSRRAA